MSRCVCLGEIYGAEGRGLKTSERVHGPGEASGSITAAQASSSQIGGAIFSMSLIFPHRSLHCRVLKSTPNEKKSISPIQYISLFSYFFCPHEFLFLLFSLSIQAVKPYFPHVLFVQQPVIVVQTAAAGTGPML